MENNRFSLDGKLVVLIGGMGILGRVCAEHLLDAGAKLIIADLDGEACNAHAKELCGSYPDRAYGYGVDLSDEASVAQFSDAIKEHGAAPDVLINAAAAKSPNFFAPLETFPLDDWNQILGVNVTGIFLMLRALLPKMVENGGGNVINIGSIYGEVGPDQRIYDGSHYEAMGGSINTPLIYSASKGAVSAMTRYVATTFGKDGIRANTLVPGGVFSGQNDTFVEKYSARIPMGRMAEADEIASTLVFLASAASGYMNGQEVIVDGGLTAW